MTNADRIRAMTDEELAEFFDKHIYCGTCVFYNKAKMICDSPFYKHGNCKRPILEWLKQEVDNG